MPDNTVAGFRLSAQQERAWTHQQGGPPFYAHASVLIEGALDASKLRKGLQAVVRRHEILRTVFHRQAGLTLPFQVILENGDISWEVSDCQNAGEAAKRSRIAEFFAAPFDLEQGPTLRALLAVNAPQRHTLFLQLPSVCADTRSLHNLISELGNFFAAGATDEAEDVMQYADVVQWQTELLESEDTRAGREFWRNYGRSIDFAALAKSVEHGEHKTDSSSFSPSAVTLDLNIADANALAAATSNSPANFLVACWTVLHHRLTGRRDITLGGAFDGRKYAELENAIGPFARHLPLQFSFDSSLTFADVLRKTTALAGEAHEWQESFDWRFVDSSTDLAQPVLPLVCEYTELPAKQSYGDVTFTVLEQYACCDRFKLKLAAFRTPRVLRLEFHYDSSRFARSSVEQLAGYFHTLLQAALAKPDTLISRLPLLNDKQRQQLLVDWNQTSASYPEQQCLHQLFEAQARRTPDRPAIRFNQVQLSYRELNESANQLAHHLRSLGVGPDSLVGLCVERSAEMMVALLAILKAGGAYVPLNPDNPKPRLAQQLAGAVALITEQKLLPQMPEFPGKTLVLDRDQSSWSNQPRNNPTTNTTPENLVYVIYTSGSTGVPKGVAVRHRNLVNYSHFITQRLNLEQHPEGLHFATVSTIGADLGNTCIYPALISGGCLHVIAYEVSTDAQRFSQYTHEHPIDVLKIVPSHLQALLHSSDAAQVLPRQFLITGGETLTAQLIEKILSLNPECSILNHYGPTETTVGSLTLKLDDYDWKNSSHTSIPIGRPIANTQVYILDDHLEPVPVGVVGELYIAGAGVTAGYLNQPERTAERFLKNPFVDDPDAKMYRTGDLARYTAEGNVEFLGRGDDQVKIRGFRIELGEIESLLAQHPKVKQAVVLAKEDDRGEKRLVAYAVAQREQDLTSESLRAYLKEQLPDYMVPSAIVLLAKLPLNANGKIDRQALPEPEQVQTKAYVAPRTPTEEVIANIWAEVLRRDKISIEDNFFDLGGHSLLATQVISRIRRTLNADIPLRALFETPTVARIAQQAELASKAQDAHGIPPITRVPRNQALPLSFAQQRLWVLDQLEPNNPLYNIPRSLRMQGALDVESLRKAINQIVTRHESQRTTFSTQNREPVQVIAPSLILSLPVQDLTHLPQEQREPEARRIAATEAATPFNLTVGPLVRATLLKLDANDHILLLTMHHIVSDAWSAGVFVQELSELYEAFSAGRPSPLPELPIQYADYAAWQRQWFQGDVLRQQLDYWRQQLKGAPPLLALPSDRPRPKVRSFQGALENIPVSPDVAAALKTFTREEGSTLFMTLLAGFQALLSRYTGQEQIVVGTDVANRTTTETEHLIGFFINLLALRTDLSGNPTFREILRRVREVTLGAYAHQDMPFDKLVEELQPERNLSHNPLVQVLFVMQNLPRRRRELTGLTLSAFEMPITRSKFDLAVFMTDGESGLYGSWLYSTDLFDRDTIVRMASHFESFLRNALTEPDARLNAIEMLSEEEKQQRGAEKKQRKQSQLKKLLSVEPKTVTLTHTGDKD